MEIRTRSFDEETKVQMQKPSTMWLSVCPGKTKTAPKVPFIHLPKVRLKYVYL